MAVPLIKQPFRGLKGRYGGSQKCGLIGDMHQTPGYGIDVLNTPKCQYFDGSNTFEQEFCYILKTIFFGDTLQKPHFLELLLWLLLYHFGNLLPVLLRFHQVRGPLKQWLNPTFHRLQNVRVGWGWHFEDNSQFKPQKNILDMLPSKYIKVN